MPKIKFISTSTLTIASHISETIHSSFFLHLRLKTYKKFFYLATEPVWYIGILFLNYFAIIAVIYGSFNARCLEEEVYNKYRLNEIIYALDIIYAIDIIMVIGCKLMPSFDITEVDMALRPTWILILEGISLIPLELFLSRSTDVRQWLFCFLKLTKVLRFARILYFYVRHRNLIGNQIFVRIVAMLSMEILIIMLTWSIYCNAKCIKHICKDPNCESYEMIVIVTAVLTSSGLPRYSSNVTWSFISVVGLTISYYFIYMLTTCEIAHECFQKHVRELSFVINYNNVIFKEKKWKSPKYLKESTHTYFNSVWRNRKGYHEINFLQEDLPPCIKNEMMIDVAWSVFRHSHLFTNQTLPFLREVSKYITHEYKLPGEFIWKRGQWKNKMVYIASGTVQLLSEEDGDSPLLCLTSGTCLGDSCLVRTYPSRNNVRCKNFCQIYTLSAGDFGRLYNKFGVQYSLAVNGIKWRYGQAKNLNKLVIESKNKMQGIERSLDVFGLLWTKNTLHKHMSRNAESRRRHRFQNIYLLNEINPKNYKQMIFSANFLDSYAISERLEIDTDTVFLKPNCPCILQPDSVIVYFWEFFVICITVCLAFLIPRKAFIPQTDVSWLPILMTTCTIIYVFDIYFQFSTGLITRDGPKTSIKVLAKERMGTFGFWADLFSCFPLEVLKCVIYSEVRDSKSNIMYMNRLLKLWRLENVLRKWEEEFNAKLRLIQFIRFTWTIMYSIYFCYCALHCVIEGKLVQQELVFIAVQLVTMTGINLGKERNVLFFFFMDIMALTLILWMYAHFIAVEALHNLKEVHVQRYARLMYGCLKKKPRYSKKIKSYLNTQWQDNRCENVLRAAGVSYDIPKSLHSEVFLYATKDKIAHLKPFSMLPQEVVYKMLSTILKHAIYPPNEFLVKSGDITRMVTIVYGGVTEILTIYGTAIEIDSKPYAVNFVEAALRAPSGINVMTVSHVKVLYFDILDYEAVLNRYYQLRKDYKTTIENCFDLKVKFRILCEQERDVGIIIKESAKPGRSFYSFAHNFLKDSYGEYDYFIPYDKLYPFGFIRYFLMRLIFLPDGKFLFYWECVRCVCAVITCIFYFSFPFINYYRHLSFILDITCVADIYVRMHVAYYNRKGILVWHPVRTAKYYLTHSFIIDFLGALPLGYFSAADAFGYLTLNVPRLLQLYRYVEFMKYLKKDPTKPCNKFLGFMYIPIALIITNMFGTLIVTVSCVKQMGTLMCLQAIMIASSNTNWFSDTFIHINALYVATTAFMNVGMGIFQLSTHFSINCVALMCVLGLYFKSFVIAQLLTLYSFRQENLIWYQQQIVSLKFFLNSIHTHPVLRKAVLNSYELKWELTRGYDIQELSKTIVGTIRTDLIYSYYGEELYQKCTFTFKRRSFYRNLLVNAKYECYPQGGFILTLNDITNRLYILYSGAVEVIAPDGTVLARLHPTSFFGHLQYGEFGRMGVSVVAAETSEVLFVDSLTFHDLLGQYPKIKNEFEDLRITFFAYIQSKEDEGVEIKIKDTVRPSSLAHSKRKRLWLKVYQKLMSWNFLMLWYCSYFEVVLDLYQFGALEYSFQVFILQYIGDLLYLSQLLDLQVLRSIKEFAMAAYRGKCKNWKFSAVKAKFRRKNTRLFLGIVSLIPIDLPILLFMENTQAKYRLYSFFRINRALRLIDLVDFINTLYTRLNTNVTFVRVCYITFWLSLLWLCMASLVAVVACSNPNSMLPLLPPCHELLLMTSWGRFRQYIKYISLVCDFLTTTGQHSYTPQNISILAIFIFNKLVSLYLLAVMFSQVYSIVIDCNRSRVQYREFGTRIKTLFRLEDVSEALITKTMRYIQLLRMRKKGNTYPLFVREAPLYLQDVILFEVYYPVIGLHPLFVNCHKDFVRQIIQKTKTDIYFNEDYIQISGMIAPTMYFIYKGSVKVIRESLTQDEMVKTLHSGESFGIIEGLYGRKPHQFTFQAEGSAIVISLDLEKWVSLLDFFPSSEERIYDVATNYIGDEIKQE